MCGCTLYCENKDGTYAWAINIPIYNSVEVNHPNVL